MAAVVRKKSQRRVVGICPNQSNFAVDARISFYDAGCTFGYLARTGVFGAAHDHLHGGDLLFPGVLGILSFPAVQQGVLDIDPELPVVLSDYIHDSGDSPVYRAEKAPEIAACKRGSPGQKLMRHPF